MRVLPPLTITPAMLTSTTVAEPSSGEQVWDSGETYAVDEEVISTTLHWTWASITGGSNKALPSAAGESNDNWLSVGPTNRWKMFDLLRNTASVGASPMTVVLTPGRRVDALGLVGVVADEVEVTVERGGSTIYTYSQAMLTRNTLGYLDYFTGSFRQVQGLGVWNLPLSSDAVITVTLTRASGDVTLGGLLIGRQEYLGEAELGAESDARNFSSIERDFAGTAELIQRRSIPTTSQRVLVDKARLNRIREVRDELNAVPALWSWLDDVTDDYFEAGFLLGVYTRWRINAEHPNHAMQQIDVEEL